MEGDQYTRPQDPLSVLQGRVNAFVAARDWSRYRDPKSLILALMGEVGELAEIFQWLGTEEAFDAARNADTSEHVRDEMADVLLYLVGLADVLGVDLMDVAVSKMKKNELKYPAEAVRGTVNGVGRV